MIAPNNLQGLHSFVLRLPRQVPDFQPDDGLARAVEEGEGLNAVALVRLGVALLRLLHDGPGVDARLARVLHRSQWHLVSPNTAVFFWARLAGVRVSAQEHFILRGVPKTDLEMELVPPRDSIKIEGRDNA